MTTIFRAFCTCFVLALLPGCEASNVKKDISPDDVAQSALIVGSVTQNEDAGIATSAAFYFNSKVSDLRKKVRAKQSNPIGPIASVNEFRNSGVAGRLFVLELPPGHHVLDRWDIEYGDGNGFTIYPKVPPPVLDFELQPGQVVYVGNFHMQIETGKNLIGFTIPVGGTPEIRDEQQRDVARFRERYPRLQAREVTVKVLQPGKWEGSMGKEEELEVPKSQ